MSNAVLDKVVFEEIAYLGRLLTRFLCAVLFELFALVNPKNAIMMAAKNEPEKTKLRLCFSLPISLGIPWLIARDSNYFFDRRSEEAKEKPETSNYIFIAILNNYQKRLLKEVCCFY